MPSGSANGSWKGGIHVAFGYVFKLEPSHPYATSTGYVREHRLVMEEHLGRLLLPSEIVHHRGTKYPLDSMENRSDNRIENLALLPGGQAEHLKFHKHPRLGYRKWDYSKVYELKDRTGWTDLKIGFVLGIPEPTVNMILRKRANSEKVPYNIC